MTTYPTININEMSKALSTLCNSAPNFDPKLIAYVDNATVNRDGFDFYKWSYWGMANTSGSICAVVSGVYGQYQRFRKLENRDWAAHWKKLGIGQN